MTFKGLACDYDGTLASQDRIGAAALAALTRAREAGVRLILVTGRSFFDLIRSCERLDLFDAVVAENGAVLYFPAAGMIRDQGPPPPPRLLAELDRRGIFYHAGRVVVGTGRQDELAVRAALASTDVTLDLVYNRGSMMLLPAGISKGTSMRQVIGILGLSFHDVLAVGDAENDLDLFEACGWAGCPPTRSLSWRAARTGSSRAMTARPSPGRSPGRSSTARSAWTSRRASESPSGGRWRRPSPSPCRRAA